MAFTLFDRHAQGVQLLQRSLARGRLGHAYLFAGDRLEEIERQAILAALKQHNYNRTETAKALGISRRSLIYKLQRFRQSGFVIE